MDFMEFHRQITSKPIPKELAFPEAEYRQRVDKVRKIMGQKDLDALMVSFVPNVCYLSGYQAFATDFPTYFILPPDGEPILQVIQLEMSGAFLSSWVKDVRPVSWVGKDTTTSGLVAALKGLGLEAKRIGVEKQRLGLPIHVYEQVSRRLPNARFVDASEVVPEVRLVKSPAELEHMRTAAKATNKGMAAALAAVRAGGTDNDVAAAGYQALVANGSEYMSTQPIVASGYRSGYPHTSFKRTPLKQGDTVMVELGATYQRYTSGLMRTAIIGEPSNMVRRLAEASKAALDILFQAAKPGRTGHDVAMEVRKALKGVESETYQSGAYGYSIGLGFPPTWREELTWVAEGIDRPLLPGMTFHSPISSRVPSELNVGFSETWAVTETGVEVITEKDGSARELHVVPA